MLMGGILQGHTDLKIWKILQSIDKDQGSVGACTHRFLKVRGKEVMSQAKDSFEEGETGGKRSRKTQWLSLLDASISHTSDSMTGW